MRVSIGIKQGKRNEKQWTRDKTFANRSVLAGPSGKHAFLARIHEFGCSVPVTDKMRAFLHYNGVHLKKNTRFLHIPERAFLRGGYDAMRGELGRQVAEIWCSSRSAELELEDLGRSLQEGIREYVRAGVAPPKKDFPLSRGTKPLIDTGAMVEGIQFEVR